MSTTDGGPAYPYVVVTKVDGATGSPLRQEVQTGMSLRDYFAGQALAGLTSSLADVNPEQLPNILGIVARDSFKFADAILAEREKSR